MTTTLPEWFMHRQPDPEQLVAEVAQRHRVDLGPTVAKAIADALFAYATHALQIRRTMSRDAWQNLGYREHFEQRARIDLLDQITKQGMIPTALPSRAVRYLTGIALPVPQQPLTEVPPDAVLAGADYDLVELTLAVQVRAPALDRAAAVRAGITEGAR